MRLPSRGLELAGIKHTIEPVPSSVYSRRRQGSRDIQCWIMASEAAGGKDLDRVRRVGEDGLARRFVREAKYSP